MRTDKISAKRIALCGVAVALSLVLGYVEHLVPFPIGIYGIKLGLANLATVVCLYVLGAPAALAINFARIMLSSLLFGNAVSLVYSLCGGMLSALAMVVVARSKRLSCVGVSLVGGLTHNVAQLCVAIVIVDSLSIAFYLPVLLAAGALTGFVIGLLALPITKNSFLQKFKYK